MYISLYKRLTLTSAKIHNCGYIKEQINKKNDILPQTFCNIIDINLSNNKHIVLLINML